MGIDRKVEQAARTMLGHAMRHELDALTDTIQSVGGGTLLGTIPLFLLASAYIVIDVSGMRWPNDVVLRKIADNASKSAPRKMIAPALFSGLTSRVTGVSFTWTCSFSTWIASGRSRVCIWPTAIETLGLSKTWNPFADAFRSYWPAASPRSS